MMAGTISSAPGTNRTGEAPALAGAAAAKAVPYPAVRWCDHHRAGDRFRQGPSTPGSPGRNHGLALERAIHSYIFGGILGGLEYPMISSFYDILCGLEKELNLVNIWEAGSRLAVALWNPYLIGDTVSWLCGTSTLLINSLYSIA